MKKSIKLFLAILFSVNIAVAQKSETERANKMVKILTEKLTLTQQQQVQATEIFTAHFKIMKDLRSKQKSNKNEATKTAIRDQQKQTNRAINDMLTPEQRDKYIALKKEMRNNAQNRNKDKKAKHEDANLLEEHLNEDVY
jgi:hypothetical protein